MARSRKISTKTRSILENPLTYIAVLFLTLLANLAHSAYEYKYLTNDGSYLPYAMLLTVDLAVILFAYNGNKIASILFTVFLFLINASYFYRVGDFELTNIQDVGISIIFSAIFSISIYIFSEEFVKRVNKK